MLKQCTGLVYTCQGRGVAGEGLDGEEVVAVVAKCGHPPQNTGSHWISRPGHSFCQTGSCCLHDLLLAHRRDPSGFLQNYAMLKLTFFES